MATAPVYVDLKSCRCFFYSLNIILRNKKALGIVGSGPTVPYVLENRSVN